MSAGDEGDAVEKSKAFDLTCWAIVLLPFPCMVILNIGMVITARGGDYAPYSTSLSADEELVLRQRFDASSGGQNVNSEVRVDTRGEEIIAVVLYRGKTSYLDACWDLSSGGNREIVIAAYDAATRDRVPIEPILESGEIYINGGPERRSALAVRRPGYVLGIRFR